MPWTRQRDHFALVAHVAPGRVLVLLGGDSYAEVRERGRILWELKPGCPLRIVWGVDGAPVTPAQVLQLTETQAWPTGTAAPSGSVMLGPVYQAPPLRPRQVRPEIGPKAPPERPPLPQLEEISLPDPIRDLAQAATTWLRRQRPACDNLGADAPKSDETVPAA
jgi:hypothetical protein